MGNGIEKDFNLEQEYIKFGLPIPGAYDFEN